MAVCQTRRYDIMYRMHKLFILIIFFIFPLNIFAETQGERLFIENNPEDSVEVLESEIIRGEITPNTYNFLGLGYYQLGLFDKAINAFERGLNNQQADKSILLFNQGNAYYALKNYTAAAESYGKSLNEDPLMYPSLLNRANSFLMDNNYSKAREEYISFLQKCPNDPQKTNIQEIIKLLDVEIERIEEEERLLAEANKPQWEQIDDPLIALGIKTDDNNYSTEEWEEINSQPEQLSIDQLEYMAIGPDDAENGKNGDNEEQLDNLGNNIAGYGTMVTNNYNTYNENYYNSYGNNPGQNSSSYVKSNGNEQFEKLDNNLISGDSDNLSNGVNNRNSESTITSNINDDGSNLDKENLQLDESLNEKRRQLAEAEEKRKSAQAALDKQLEEHKKLSEEEQQKLNELAELEKKLEEYRKLTEAEQQRLAELDSLEKEIENSKNKLASDSEELSGQEQNNADLLEKQRLENEAEHQRRLDELAQYEKMLEEQKKALEEEQNRLTQLAEKQKADAELQKAEAERQKSQLEMEREETQRLKEEAEKQRLAAEQELLKAQEELSKNAGNKGSSLSEDEMREQIRRELLEAENARRKQMLDDVANSLQNSSSTNMSSGAEDIIDYKFEGELD